MKHLKIFIIILLLSGCAAPKILETSNSTLEQIGFSLVSTYWAYDAKITRMLKKSRLPEAQKTSLKKVRQAAQPFVQPTAEAAVELQEYINGPYVDHAQRVILERNMQFWINHFRPHVEVLVNTVRTTYFQ